MGSPVSRAVRLALLVGAVVLLGVSRGVPALLVVGSVVVMIFLHELGHYVAAKRAGMKVTEFFIGFGPRIWSFHRGETEYGVKAIPAGAYVRIVGMNNLDEVDPADESRTYRQANFRSRLGVGVAGSAMHFAIALTLLFVQFAFIGWGRGDAWQVDRVTPFSAAAEAGIRSGDQLVTFDGQKVTSFEDFSGVLRSADVGPVPVVVLRDGERITLTADLARRVKVVGTVGEDLDVIDGGNGLRVGAVRPGGVLDGAGLLEGDRVVALAGVPITSLADVAPAVERATGGRISVTTDGTAGEQVRRVDLGSDVASFPATAFLGVGDRPVLETRSVPVAAGAAVAEFGRLVGGAVAGVGKFAWPPNIAKFVGGTLTGAEEQDPASTPTLAQNTPVSADQTRPVSIVGAVMVGTQLTSENLAFLVLFMIQLNIFIGVFNLIPLLPFDGGHVVIACYEKAQELRKRTTTRHIADVSRMLPVAYGVVMVLVVVGLMAMYLDVTRGVSL
ncbi:MAG: RIP metalloprotease [Actinomycetes bacterium]